MGKNSRPIKQDQANVGGDDTGQDIDLSAFFHRGLPESDQPAVRVTKDE